LLKCTYPTPFYFEFLLFNFELQKFPFYFVFQSAFMTETNAHLETLKDIRQMMEKSSRFISLSGLSGIAAGCCALAGAWFARKEIARLPLNQRYTDAGINGMPEFTDTIRLHLLYIAAATLTAAVILAFLFTYIRSRKNNQPIWDGTSKRMAWNFCFPLAVGGIFLLMLVDKGMYGFVAPGCLIFYGLAVINGGKYTLSEIQYLGYAEALLGIVNLFFMGKGLIFWTIGFGALHIFYGTIMWLKYERNR
jgi:hypothetical protein